MEKFIGTVMVPILDGYVARMFHASNKGVQITFENGWTASVQFGSGNYCEHHFKNVPLPGQGQYFTDSKDAEVAARKGEKWHKFKSRDPCVKGWCSPKEVLKFLNMVARKKA